MTIEARIYKIIMQTITIREEAAAILAKRIAHELRASQPRTTTNADALRRDAIAARTLPDGTIIPMVEG